VDDLTTVTDAVLTRPARLGGTRLVCVDGPAGSGKTTLARRLADLLEARGRSTAVVHMDDLYQGWTGLSAAERRVEEWLLAPLAAGREAVYRRYDWQEGGYAEPHTVPAVDVLILEGVGSGCAGHADRTTLLVWVEAPAELRLRRGLERDGPALQDHWRRWMVVEADFHEQDRTRGRADVRVDGESGAIRETGAT
jgi:uridine kinase